jgi:hypothetical protein
MKFILILSALLLFSCKHRQDGSADPVNRDSASNPMADVYYENSELSAFFDSVSQKDCTPFQLSLTRYTDSVFIHRTNLNRKIQPVTFEKLKQSIEFGHLDLTTGKEIFDMPLDSTFIKEGSIEISFVPFEKAKGKFGKFAIVIGSLLSAWENDIYFFDGASLVAKHHNFHKNGDTIHWFLDSDGNTVVYYLQNFGGGSGIWQYNYFFYKYLNGRLVSVLNILENGNLHWSSVDPRHFWLETTVVKTSPLKLKFVYNYELSDYNSNWTDIKKDSTEVVFDWDKNSSKYIGHFPDKFDMLQIYCYYLDDKADLYTVCADKKHLASILHGQDSAKRKAVLFFLNKLKNDTRIKTQGT